MSRLVVLDESKNLKYHPLLAIGGIVVDLDQIRSVETSWVRAKGTDNPIKFSETPADRCRTLFATIAAMPLQVLVCLLEDFRPYSMRLRGVTSRRDIYVYRYAFEYVLQRLSRQSEVNSPGICLVAFDRRDDFSELEEVYSMCYKGDWPIGRNQSWPGLADKGFAMSLLTLAHGPLHEIADFVVGWLTLFAAVCCAKFRGKRVDQDHLSKSLACASVIRLLPRGPQRKTRVGWSVIVHTKQLTGKELLKQHLEGWLDKFEPKDR